MKKIILLLLASLALLAHPTKCINCDEEKRNIAIGAAAVVIAGSIAYALYLDENQKTTSPQPIPHNLWVMNPKNSSEEQPIPNNLWVMNPKNSSEEKETTTHKQIIFDEPLKENSLKKIYKGLDAISKSLGKADVETILTLNLGILEG